MKYKIIWLIDALKPGGAEQLMPTLLSNFNKEHFEMRVCALMVKDGNPLSKELTDMGIPVDIVHANSLKNPLNLFKLTAYFNKHQPDLIHTQLQFSDILGNIAAKIKGIPSVSTLHTLDDIANEHGSSFWRKKMSWFVLRNFCDRVIVVSNKTKEHHIHTGKLPEKHTKTLYNGIQLSRFQNRNPARLVEKKQDLHIEPDHKIITTIAVLREAKGIQYMIDALSMILDQDPRITYLIVGEGLYGTSLRDRIVARNLEKHIVMAGHRTDIPDLLAMSDLFVLPSLGDALPTVLIEALAAGTPIIATDVGGIPEIIEHGKNGILVPPANTQALANSCMQLLKDKEKSKQLLNAGLKTAREKFDVKSQVQQLERIYYDLILQSG